MSDLEDACYWPEIWGDPDAEDEGEEIDPNAPSSDFSNGQELDWAHGYGRGQ